MFKMFGCGYAALWVFESNPGVRYIAGTPGRASSGQAWAYGMPATFGSSTAASYKYSICANYTVEDDAPQVTLIGNPYMYTARAYDIETGLYYYRARYYNPHIGRFLQVDPAREGMNWYAYCGNNSINCVDPSGCVAYYSPFTFTPLTAGMEPFGNGITAGKGFRCTIIEVDEKDFNSISDWVTWMMDWTSKIGNGMGTGSAGGVAWLYGVSINDINSLPGWLLAGNSGASIPRPDAEKYFWYLMAVNELLPKSLIDPKNPKSDKKPWFDYLKISNDLKVNMKFMSSLTIGEDLLCPHYDGKYVWWSTNIGHIQGMSESGEKWFYIAEQYPIIVLAHELQHAKNHYYGYDINTKDLELSTANQKYACEAQNQMTIALVKLGLFGPYEEYKNPYAQVFNPTVWGWSGGY